MSGATPDITPNSAVMEMARLSRQLDELGHRLKSAEREAVDTEHAYRVAKAKALLAVTDGTVPEREAQALLKVEAERLAALPKCSVRYGIIAAATRGSQGVVA